MADYGIGNSGIAIIKHYESLHDGDLTTIGLQPKLCPANVWTVGWGHAITDNGKFLKGDAGKKRAYELYPSLTEEEAEQLLHEDIKRFEGIVNKRLKVELNQSQYDAVLSHTFNTGGSDTLFRLINENASIDSIKDWFLHHYITADGKVLKGLIRRRKTEAHLFVTGDLVLFS